MRFFKYFSALVLFVLLFFGGLGIEKELVQIIGTIVVFGLLIMSSFFTNSLRRPKNFTLYIIFLGLLLASFFWSSDWKNSLEYFILFLGGGVFWLYSFNFSKHLKPYFTKLVIGLGLIFTVFFFLNYAGSETAVSSWSLHLAYSSGRDHFHLGDLWAIVLVVISYGYIKKKRILSLGLIILGTYILLLSRSRSAYFALAAGILVFLRNKAFNKKLVLGLLALALSLFVIVGVNKPTFTNRQYFLQSLAGIYHNPLGIGMGNFSEISANPKNWIFGLSGFSSIAHNIVLEVMAGIGIFGLTFAYWLYKVSREVWEGKKGDTIYKAVFFALLVNFLFDSTYFIPAMLWLWFVSLGLVQARIRRE